MADLDVFRGLFQSNYMLTPDGRYFLPFSKTYGAYPNTVVDEDLGDVTKYGSWNSGGNLYSSLDELWNTESPFDLRTGRPDDQNSLGYNLNGLTAEQMAAMRGTYNGQLGYYVDPSRITGTHPATTGGSKPNDSGLWQMLSLIAPAAAGVYGAVASGSVAGGGAAASEAGVASSAGSGAAAGAAGESGVAASGASSGGAGATGAEAGSAATQAPAAATAADNTLTSAMQTINSTPGLKSQLLNEVVGEKNAAYLSPILTALSGSLGGSSGSQTLTGGSGNDTLSGGTMGGYTVDSSTGDVYGTSNSTGIAAGSTTSSGGNMDYTVDPDTGDVIPVNNDPYGTGVDYSGNSTGQFAPSTFTGDTTNTGFSYGDLSSDPNYYKLAQQYGPQIAKLLTSLGGGSKGLGGGGSGGLLGDVSLGSTLPGILALAYAAKQPGIDTSKISGVFDAAGANAPAFTQAAIDPVQKNIAAGYGDLLQSQALRGIRGSSFGNTDIANYMDTTGRTLGDVGATAAQKALGLQGDLAGQIAQLQAQSQQMKNSLYGRAFDVLGRGLNPRGYGGLTVNG